MGKAHFLIYCDRELVDNAIRLILESDAGVEVVSFKVIEGELIDDTTEKHELRRGREEASIRIIVGDRESQVGPYNGEYWIFVDGETQSLFNCNEPFARELAEILIANGGRETRKKDSNA